MRIRFTSITAFEYVVPLDRPLKGLLISDLHIGYAVPRADSTREVVDLIRSVVDHEKITVVFILGDIIHFHPSNFPSLWLNFYSTLEALGVEVHTIPGNHDRYLHAKVVSQYAGVHVHPHQSDLIIVRPRGTGRTVVLGHDIHNDKRVHGTDNVRKWFTALRTTFRKFIQPDSLLILGHVHWREVSEDQLTHSLAPFSYDLGKLFYGILEPDDCGTLSVRWSSGYNIEQAGIIERADCSTLARPLSE